jgi:hypothetical protein
MRSITQKHGYAFVVIHRRLMVLILACPMGAGLIQKARGKTITYAIAVKALLIKPH